MRFSFFIFVFCFAFASLLALPALAVPQVKSIEILGQRKLEKDAILSRLKSKIGQAYNAENVREDILVLFKAGYFYDVQVEKKVVGENVTLIYKVLEKPNIAEILYEGNSEIKSEDIADATGVKTYEIINHAKLKDATDKVQKLYEDKGYFLAKIEYQIDEIKKDESVRLTWKIREGEKVKVKKITFLGNKNLSDSALKSKMMTQEEGYFTGISGSGAYKQEVFERDVQVLRLSYYNQGYIQAKVDRPQVYVTPDKKGIYLTIRVEEGDQYDVGEVDFAGDILFPREELMEAIKIHQNKVFAYDVLQKDLGELQAKYGDLGYAYANVIPRWSFLEKEKKVNLVFEIDKGSKVYFGQINVVGNTKTRDKVLRRELKVREGELYNETRRRQSLENIQRLGFFEDVNFKTSTPQDKLDVMNVDIMVKERNTGQVQVSAGYGSSSGFTFGGSVQQANFLGRGQNLGVSMQLTSTSNVYDVSFTDPYFNDTKWSLGYRVFRSENSGRTDYNESRTGGSMTLGHPLMDYVHFSMTYGYTAIRLSDAIDGLTGQSITDYDLFPLSTASGDASTLSASLDYDTRNDRFRPSKGIYARTAYSHTGLIGGNLRYYKATADFRYFKNVIWDVVWRNSVSYGQVGSTEANRNAPFNELFLLGGPYSLRGYRYGRVGKMVFSNKVHNQLLTGTPPVAEPQATQQAMRFFGGANQLQYQTELQFPLIKEADMFGVVFYDMGVAEDTVTSSHVFADTGFGIRWFSPIGPLRFEWGFPLNRDPLYHENSIFEFSIGTPF